MRTAWPWQWWHWEKSYHKMFLISNQCIPLKNTLSHSVAVSHMSELLILSVIFCLITPVHKFWPQVCYKLNTSQMATSGKWYVQTYVFHMMCTFFQDKWAPVRTAWCVLMLWMEERPPTWRIAANILNKQSRTANKGWSYRLGFGWDANSTSQ
jgi:hypothetical protein